MSSNNWVTFVRTWAAEKGVTYGNAMKDPELKVAYNATKPVKEKKLKSSTTETSATNVELDVEPILEQIVELIVEPIVEPFVEPIVVEPFVEPIVVEPIVVEPKKPKTKRPSKRVLVP